MLYIYLPAGLTKERISMMCDPSTIDIDPSKFNDEISSLKSSNYIEIHPLSLPHKTVWHLTPEGILYVKKILSPLLVIARDGDQLSNILDKTEGTEKAKKELNDFFKKIKDKMSDEAYDEMKLFLKDAGKEVLFFVIQLIFESRK
jgi:hypothetical protein